MPSPLTRLAAANAASQAADQLALAAMPPETRPAGLEVVVPLRGGHNGFHAPGDPEFGCWSDRLTTRWLRRRVCG